MNARLATLDRMLDDLKSTVTSEDEGRKTPLGIRSSSRSSSRAGSLGRRGLDGGVVDGGRLTHHRKEYTSPDHTVRTVADTYQYDSGDTNPSGHFQKKVVKSTYSSYNVDGGLTSELDSLRRGPTEMEMERALSQESRNILESNKFSSRSTENSKGRDGRSLSNGHYDDDMIINDEKGGEVRRIVWRNRYEKTYETTDSSTPTISIEKDAQNRRYMSSDVTEANTISSLTRPHVPPQISPGGQSWAEPVPLPTPPQISPNREPGVAYIYNYGSHGGSTVQPLPPLNYVAVAPPTGDGAPSPTPSNPTGQPVIYHYSYHYTIQPGQPLPDGAHPPSSPPTLQIAPPPASGYSANSTNVNKTTINEVHHHTTSRDTRHHVTTNKVIHEPPLGYLDDGKPDYPGNGRPGYPRDGQPGYPRDGQPGYPRDGQPGYPRDGQPGYPGDRKPPADGKPGSSSINYSVNSSTNYVTETHHHPFPTGPGDKGPREPPYDDRDPPLRPNDPSRNITININKTTTHTTRTTRDGDYPSGGDQPLTSTPYRGRSRSPDRRYPSEPRYPSGPSDSLERVRRVREPGLPFPDTSPVRPVGEQRLPRRVDDLLNEFPVKNGGPHRTGYNAHPDSEPLLSTQTRHVRDEIIIPPPERNEINTVSPAKLREEREKTKNIAGPPVYYPPGHEAFAESMHTMTLKEEGRRGKAKWRREAASGYKESSSHSESKGDMKVVPLCLPLCGGFACTIM
ncbi:proteoglycan 4 isoform X2 [Hyalella azteca]|uniref:Proteoglycan 4 isoform X2 n=1 Tax=Hyalella azteca TaxID=294128 RepID=A0A8B7NGK3_HYAAZ|nr:proteoglycan 4 isoform X2 [Hyalella azteca]